MTTPDPGGESPAPLEAPLSAAEFSRFTRLTRWIPSSWILTSRRRRLLLLALAAPGFLALTTTPIHRNFPVLLAGAVLFTAALGFRRFTERTFARAEAAALWPPSPVSRPETRHA